MSCTGSFQLGGAYFPTDPLNKRWAAQEVGRRGTREPIFTSVWRLELDFGTLQAIGEFDFFESRFLTGGLYVATLPHPVNGLLTQFTGVSIESVDGTFNDIGNNFWVEGTRVVLGVNLMATGSA